MIRSVNCAAKLRSLRPLRGARAFSSYTPLRSGHGHAEESKEARFQDTPTLLWLVAAVTGTIVYMRVNSDYKKKHQESLATTVMSKLNLNAPAIPREEVVQEQNELDAIIEKETHIREAMTLLPPKREIRDIYLTGIPTGSPMNCNPGQLLDLGNIGPRRKPKTIFDD